MTDKEIYRIWAPVGKRWVDWIRPVPFVEIHEITKNYSFTPFEVPEVDFMNEECKGAAIIVDLSGADSVEEGIALAKKGYRPIPLFNGTIEQPGARATVDNQSVVVALFSATKHLMEIELADDALPVFMLDSNRLNRYKVDVSVFDNSWDIFPQDMPTADYFLKNGITKMVVVGKALSRDLKKILYEYQKKKIQIYLTNGYEEPKKVKIRKQIPVNDD